MFIFSAVILYTITIIIYFSFSNRSNMDGALPDVTNVIQSIAIAGKATPSLVLFLVSVIPQSGWGVMSL